MIVLGMTRSCMTITLFLKWREASLLWECVGSGAFSLQSYRSVSQWQQEFAFHSAIQEVYSAVNVTRHGAQMVMMTTWNLACVSIVSLTQTSLRDIQSASIGQRHELYRHIATFGDPKLNNSHL